MTTPNDTLKEDILEALLSDKDFQHQLIMGKYGYHPDEVTARVNTKIDELIQSS
jgi:hypothetical protein|tara:strand:- start:333 stop:494 length:162 start_codon:yes stop_codon:yes gene_type:complete